jgi:hypothetical protein
MKERRSSMKWSASPMADATHRSRWWAYLLIGIALVVTLTWVGFTRSEPLSHTYDRGVKLAIYTLAIFGSLLKWGWRYRTTGRFWVLFTAFFASHCAVVVSLPFFSGYGPSSNLMLGLFGVSEFVALAMVVAMAMRERF